MKNDSNYLIVIKILSLPKQIKWGHMKNDSNYLIVIDLG